MRREEQHGAPHRRDQREPFDAATRPALSADVVHHTEGPTGNRHGVPYRGNRYVYVLRFKAIMTRMKYQCMVCLHIGPMSVTRNHRLKTI